MKSFPFTSKVDYDPNGYPQFDRAVDSAILRNVLKQYVTNGVFPNPSTNFQVVVNNDTAFTVRVKAGACIINGSTGYEIEDRILTVQAADPSKDRIDTVVLRFNDHTEYRNIDLYVLKGTPASQPTAPELARTQDLWELGVANIFIPAATTVLAQERITDTRLDETRCGYASFFVHIDTQVFYDQIQADLKHFKEVNEAGFEEWSTNFISTKEGEVNTWEQNFMDGVRDWFQNLRVMIDQNDVVAINDRLDYVERHYVVGQGIEARVTYINHSPALQFLFDPDIWQDEAI